MKKNYQTDEIVRLALCDNVPFSSIEKQYNLSEKAVKKIMKATIKPKRYLAWRTRVGILSRRRAHYK